MTSQPLPDSELILNPDGSIYHLHLKPEDIAHTIITVGDPDRVDKVARYFEEIVFEIQNREFKTVTGTYKNQHLTVISTGIGTDNIDIVFNELDALVNIDFSTRKVKEKHTALTFIRIGTSGAIQGDIPIDSFLISKKAVGLDSLLRFYANTSFLDEEFAKLFMEHTQWNTEKSVPYVVSGDTGLLQKFSSNDFLEGITVTNVGFYGPQGRNLRLQPQDADLNKKLKDFRCKDDSITNLEMETAGIYGMARLLGHRAISLNAILTNRVTGNFSKNPNATIDRLIQKTLHILTQ